MALLDFGIGRVARLSRAPGAINRATALDEHRSTWQRTALELAGTFLVLTGIAVGILTLRLALVLMHGVLH
jgi:hypothetical protein